jgi:hypothetical protein
MGCAPGSPKTHADFSHAPARRVPLRRELLVHTCEALLLSLATTGAAYGQCTLWNQATCASVYTQGGTPSPSLASFLSNTWASFQAIDATVAHLPQPKITLTAQNWPCEGGTISIPESVSLVSEFGPHCMQFSNLLAAAGVTTQDMNFWQAAMASSVQYQAEGVTGQYNIAGDCAGTANHPYLNLNETPGSGSGPHCWALYYYDQTINNAALNGITIRAGDAQLRDDLQACGFSPPGTLANPVITEAQYESCMIPLHKAAIARWPGITAFQVLEEPTGGMSNVQVFSVADVSTFIQHDSAALKAINSSLKIGAAGTGLSWHVDDSSYWADWTNTSGNTYPALDFFVIDLFSGSCDPSTSNSVFPGLAYYAAELANWAGPFSPGNGQYGYIRAAKATGKPIRVGQSDAPYWCPAGGTADQSYDYLGQYDIVWNTSGLFNTWLATVIPWASANGIQSFSIFFTAPLFYYSTNQLDDNASNESSGTAMASLAPTNSAATYKMLGQWWGESAQGKSRITGDAHLGH